MSTSIDYWNISTKVKDEAQSISNIADEMHAALEASDDPGEMVDFLIDIEKRLTKLAAQIGPNIPALRKVAKALDDLPGVETG